MPKCTALARLTAKNAFPLLDFSKINKRLCFLLLFMSAKDMRIRGHAQINNFIKFFISLFILIIICFGIVFISKATLPVFLQPKF